MTECASCGEAKPDVIERDVPLRTAVCNACWAAATVEPPPEPVERWDVPAALDAMVEAWEDSAPRPDAGSTGVCRDCGEPIVWHRTVNGKHVAMEIDAAPVHLVTAGHRWRIDHDGIALNMRKADWADLVRVTHFDACPARIPRDDVGPFLRGLRAARS